MQTYQEIEIASQSSGLPASLHQFFMKSHRLETWVKNLELSESETRLVAKAEHLYGYTEAVQVALEIHKYNQNNKNVEIPQQQATQTPQNT